MVSINCFCTWIYVWSWHSFQGIKGLSFSSHTVSASSAFPLPISTMSPHSSNLKDHPCCLPSRNCVWPIQAAVWLWWIDTRIKFLYDICYYSTVHLTILHCVFISSFIHFSTAHKLLASLTDQFLFTTHPSV